MTKIEVKIKKADEIADGEIKDGVYLATFVRKNDRIVFFRNAKILMQIEVNDENDELHIQNNSNLYHNYRKIKNIKIEVEI